MYFCAAIITFINPIAAIDFEQYHLDRVRTLRRAMAPVIVDLRDENKVTHARIANLFERDRGLVQEHAGGHLKFRDTVWGFTFCVSGHDKDNVGADERKARWKKFQSILNTMTGLCRLSNPKLTDTQRVKLVQRLEPADVTRRYTEEQDRFDEYSLLEPKTKRRRT